MLSLVKKLLITCVFAALPALASAQAAPPPAEGKACVGKVFNPMTDTDWNYMYPITVMGVKTGPGFNPPLMYEPPICVCPGIFGIPTPGIGITFWEPLYIAEIERTPGCLSSLGGASILSAYKTLQSEQVNEGKDGGPVSRMQMHWYEYPVFAMLDMLKSLVCYSPSGFNLLYLTEIDPTWQDDMWAAIFAPESVLFTSTLAQMACAVDSAASSLNFPIDALFWCAGSWGSVYPLSGNAAHTNSNFTSNNLVLAKFLARQSRLGLQWQTIGPTAICSSHPNPIWLKSQYRVNQVGPFPRRGVPVVIGSTGQLQVPPFANAPTRESTVNLIWQGQQCCARF